MWFTNQSRRIEHFPSLIHFVDKDKNRLLQVFEELKEKNYILVDIDKVDDTDELWTLHASKIDILTAEKLHKRNIAFNELAEYCGVEIYDGWDVAKL